MTGVIWFNSARSKAYDGGVQAQRESVVRLVGWTLAMCLRRFVIFGVEVELPLACPEAFWNLQLLRSYGRLVLPTSIK